MLIGGNMDTEGLKVEILPFNKKGQQVSGRKDCFVKITHEESGISVTKHSNKSHLMARNEAIEELNILIELWR